MPSKTDTWGDTPASEIYRQTMARERAYLFVPSERAETPTGQTKKTMETTEPMDQTQPPRPEKSEVDKRRAQCLKNYWSRMTPEEKSREMLKRRAAWKKKPQSAVKEAAPKRPMEKPIKPQEQAKPYSSGFAERLREATRHIRVELDKRSGAQGDIARLRAEYQRRIEVLKQVECWISEKTQTY